LEPVRYLPRAAISAPEAAQLLGRSAAVGAASAAPAFGATSGSDGCDELCRAIVECRLDDADRILDSLEAHLVEERIVDADELRGIAIEFLAAILAAGRSAGVDATALIGGREMLSKGIFRQSSPASALAWLRHAARSVSAGIVERSGSSGTLVDKLRAYAELHFAEPLSLKTLSDRFGLTAAYLGKVYKEGTGQSFSFFLNEYRIGKARDLLEEGRMSAKDVALAVGYAEPNYFYAMFRKITGRNPSDRGR
ncbi:MAG: helix-turn-helix domain-containing protein, partial [Spirochaetaceae bacterium]|nr:helix-turn-helix domain-containing protein [Spirochaetaceae bacterium]